MCRSSERPTGDLRERMKNKRQDVDTDTQKRDQDETTSPTTRVRPVIKSSYTLLLFAQCANVVNLYICEQQRDSSRSRHREKEDIKITKERTPVSEEEAAEWEANREGERVNITTVN